MAAADANEEPIAPRPGEAICVSCHAPVPQSAHFCPKCGAPLGPSATFDYEGMSLAEGDMLRKSAHSPKLIVVVGIWMMWLLPCLFAAMMLVLLVKEAIDDPATLPWYALPILAFLAACVAVPAIFIYRTTRGYIEGRREQAKAGGRGRG